MDRKGNLPVHPLPPRPVPDQPLPTSGTRATSFDGPPASDASREPEEDECAGKRVWMLVSPQTKPGYGWRTTFAWRWHRWASRRITAEVTSRTSTTRTSTTGRAKFGKAC